MANHRRETILSTLATLLATTSTAGANVHRHLVYDHEKSALPSINIQQGAEVPTDDNSGEATIQYIDRRVAVRLEYRARLGGDLSGDVVTTLNQIAQEVSAAIHGDHTLGLSFVMNTEEGGTEEVVVDSEGSRRSGMLTQEFTVFYRTSRTDPGA